MDCELQAVPLALRDTHQRDLIAYPVAPLVHLAIYPLQPGDRPQPIERQHGRHIIRGAVGQLQRQGCAARLRTHVLWRVIVLLLLAQGARGQSVGVEPGVIEATDAGKSGGKRNVGDGQPGFGQQPFCKQQAACLLHLFWRGA